MPFSVLQILVLPVVILDRDREADRREAELQELDMVAAAAEPVVAPDLADVEAEREIVGEAVDEAREVARRRVVLAAEAALLGGQILVAPASARPSEKHPDMGVVADPVRAAADCR